MQTFLPYPDFTATAAVLDVRRLGKQRVEALQVLRAMTVPEYGWRHHPVAKMWAGYDEALVRYGLEVCAAWTAGGTGSGSAKAGTATALTTSDASASVVKLLYPSGSADVAVTINNPNPYAVTVSSVTGNGTITSGNATCDASNGVTFTDQTGLSIVVPANGNKTTVFANAASMSNASVDACQGQTFTIPVSISGASS